MRTRVGLTDTLQYLFSDQLGSTSVAANPDGSRPIWQSYYPWGKVRQAGALPTDYGFTGQLADDTGLIQMGAVLRSSLNRFISADTIVPGAGNPQALNRYSYSLSNPVKYTDPTGHRPCNDPMGTCQGGDGTTTSPGCLEFCSGESAAQQSLGNATDVGGTVQDPAVYVSAATGAGVVFGPGIIGTAAMWLGSRCVAYSTLCAALLGAGVKTAENVSDGATMWPGSGNGQQVINGITYSEHALERMQPWRFGGGRDIPPSAVENAIKYGAQQATSVSGVIRYVYENVTVVARDGGSFVITVINTSQSLWTSITQ